MNSIELKDVCKRYPGFALQSLSLTLPDGCIMGLIGENGAGKSTTIRLLLNMIHRDNGSIRILGKESQEEIALLKEDIGVVLDEVGIPGCLNVCQVGNIMRHTYKNWDDVAFSYYIRHLAIPEGKPFKAFSRGNKMKLGIAVALSHRPRLLILDEATSGLDPVVRDMVVDLLFEFTRDERHSILISSHIVSDLEKLCDYIAFLHRGRLLLCEEKDALREQYGVVHCSAAELGKLAPKTIIGKKETVYGAEALLHRGDIPLGMPCSPVSIEDLFIFMVREVC